MVRLKKTLWYGFVFSAMFIPLSLWKEFHHHHKPHKYNVYPPEPHTYLTGFVHSILIIIAIWKLKHVNVDLIKPETP